MFDESMIRLPPEERKFGVCVEPRKAKKMSISTKHEATIIPGKTSKKCPKCGSVRQRRFERGLPMTFVQCEMHRSSFDEKTYGKKLPYKKPRVSTGISIIRFFISPRPGSDYYFCWEMATCKKCGTTVMVEEEEGEEPKRYYRQFGPIRLAIFFISDRVSLTFDWLRNLFSPNR